MEVEVQEEVLGEVEEQETLDTDNAEIAEGEEVDDLEASEEESVEEPWMLDNDGENEKPVKFLKAKKRLKGEVEAKNKEVEELKAKVEALSNGKQPPPQPGDLKRPDELDFETTEEYHKALDEYHDKRYELKQQVAQQQAVKNSAYAELSKSIEGHYERAESLIEQHGIKPENYKDADTRVRGAIASIAPQTGDIIVDQLINSMGDGSEKVMYHLGRNKTALAELQNILRTDNTGGLKAAAYLGRKLEQLTNPTRRKTKAPAPSPQAKGDTGGQTAEALKRKYDAAHKKRDGQSAFSLKRQAKKSGVDTSKW